MTIIPDIGIIQAMKLSEYLTKEDLTFAAFGKKIGTNPQAVHKYAKFENYPRPERAERIVRATKGLVTLKDIYKPKEGENG